MNVAEWLRRSASLHGGRPALALGADLVATYDALYAQAGQVAATVQRQFGAHPGDRIGLFASNHPAYIEALYAAWIAST